MESEVKSGMLIKIELTSKDMINLMKGKDVFHQLQLLDRDGSKEEANGMIRLYVVHDENEDE